MRRVRVALVVATAVLIAAAILTRPGVNRLNYERVQVGMTLEQVRGLMGAEGTELPPTSFSRTVKDGQLVDLLTGDRKFQWLDGPTDIRIGFEDGRVVSKVMSDSWNTWP